MANVSVKVIRQFLLPGSSPARIVQEGEFIEISESIAKDLERNNLVVPEVGHAMKRRAAQLGSEDPTEPRPTGGPTGEDKPASSLDPVRQPAMRRFTRRGR